jgi:hypothetical protein
MCSDIRQCFDLFIKYLKNNVKNIEVSVSDNMTIIDIKTQTNVAFMQYILSYGFSVPSTSVPVLAYEHLKKMIDEHLENDCKKISLKNEHLKEKIFSFRNTMYFILTENTDLKKELYELKNTLGQTIMENEELRNKLYS